MQVFFYAYHNVRMAYKIKHCHDKIIQSLLINYFVKENKNA